MYFALFVFELCNKKTKTKIKNDLPEIERIVICTSKIESIEMRLPDRLEKYRARGYDVIGYYYVEKDESIKDYINKREFLKKDFNFSWENYYKEINTSMILDNIDIHHLRE